MLLLVSGLNAGANSLTSLWYGVGHTGRYNYDLAPSYGLTYLKAVAKGLIIGGSGFTQSFNLYYDQQNGNIKGSSIRYMSSYAFICPTIQVHLNKSGSFHGYINGGVGMKMSGTDSLRKWEQPTFVGAPSYDSSLDMSTKMNGMVYRVGVGVLRIFHIRKHLVLTMGADAGFLMNKLSETTNPNDALLRANVDKFYKPTYFSFRIGLGYLTKPY